MSFSRKHLSFILSGTIFAVVAMILSLFDCIHYSSFNGWTGDFTSNITNFMPGTFFWLGIVEILLLFSRNRFLRVVAVLVSLWKTVMPLWIVCTMDKIGQQILDGYTRYEIFNTIPYWVAAFAAFLLLQHIVMLFALPPKKKTLSEDSLEQPIIT